MDLNKKLEKIDVEISNGLKYKAADRLRNLIQNYPNEIDLWDKLANLYYESGFLDAAGKYWILTEPTNNRIKKSVEVYEKSVNYSGFQILQEITFRGDKSQLSDFAQKKLTKLESDSKEKTKHIPEYKPILNIKKKQKYVQSFKGKIFGYLILGIIILLIILMIIGFITVIRAF